MSRHVEAVFGVQNDAAARLILADPERFGGMDSGLVRWARLVADRLTPEQRQGVLFETREAANVLR